MASRSAIINVMARAAEKAARGLIRDFGEVEHLQVSRKGPADFVSTADTKAEQTLKAELQKARPDFGFLLEEGGSFTGKDASTAGSSIRWTAPPTSCTACRSGRSRSRWKSEGEIVAGIVYEPVRDEMFWAEKGAGAWNNHQRLRVSGRRKLDEAVIATGLPFKGRGNHAKYLPQLQAVMAETAGSGVSAPRRSIWPMSPPAGSTATGKATVQPWDVAAGLLMVTEAGGFASEIGGGRNPYAGESVLAANSHLHLLLGKVLRDASANRKPKAES